MATAFVKKHILSVIFVIVQSAFSVVHGHTLPAWTWSYKKIFTAREHSIGKKSNYLYFSRRDVAYDPACTFSQLVFSWNAFRPDQGFFRFSGRVRDAETHEWSPWYVMIEWGASVQKSYADKDTTSRLSEYIHVRLEMLNNHLSDNFEIRTEAFDGADFNAIKMMAVCLSNMQAFTHEQISDEHKKLKFVHIQGIPQRSQMILSHPTPRVICSPTSTSMLVEYLCHTWIDPVDFAERSYDHGLKAYGSWPFNSAHAFTCCNGKVFFRITRLHSFATLHACLCAQIPVVVSVRGDIVGAPQSYPNGHLLLVVGYDPKSSTVLCHDPAHASDQEVFVGYDLESFLAAWERSYRLAYKADL